MKKLYRGWMKSEIDHCLFETMAENLKIGDKIEDAFGRIWEIEVVF